ncbi:MAG: hypothetical protein UR83_C0010G0011 [Candidatus Moranbacteria bacterium GW2011_GWF2_35_54]|nr:MAG: hypothetical protein UR83_C0010G0011 [Candidatus Moranbacteria bacterium GW2011_GWF2_35_54]
MNKIKNGFTLIELASIVLVSLNSARGKANRAAFISEVTSGSPSLVTVCDSATLPDPVFTSTANVTWGDPGTQSCGDAGDGSFCALATNVKAFTTTTAGNCNVYVSANGVYSDNACTTSLTSAICP